MILIDVQLQICNYLALNAAYPQTFIWFSNENSCMTDFCLHLKPPGAGLELFKRQEVKEGMRKEYEEM